jgi:DNA-binding protein Fis
MKTSTTSSEKGKQDTVLRDTVLKALKSEYFRKLKKENWPNTPELTKEINDLDTAIRNRKAELAL